MDKERKLRPLYLLRIRREQKGDDHKLFTAKLCKPLKDENGINMFHTTMATVGLGPPFNSWVFDL